MGIVHRAMAAGVAALAIVGVGAAGAGAKAPPNAGPKTGFFTGGTGTAGWVNGNDPLVPADTDNKVMQFSSPDGTSSGGFASNAFNGVHVADITALSYDFAVIGAWSGGGGGSPRLVVEFSDGGSVDLDPVTALTSGQWVHMDALTGAVDNNGGTCGYLYQASWSTAAACHAGARVTSAFVVDDSGWLAPMTVQVDNLTLNGTVYSAPSTAKH